MQREQEIGWWPTSNTLCDGVAHTHSSGVGGKYTNLQWCELPELTNWVKNPNRYCNFVMFEKKIDSALSQC